MLLTVKAELPVLLMVITAVAVAPVVTLPNARLPVTPMMRVAAVATPAPDAAMVLEPLVLSEFTVTVPLYVVTAVGANVTVTARELPAAMVPLHAPLNPAG
jgi:hypothetical protein